MHPAIVLVLLLSSILWIRSVLAYQFGVSFTAVEGLVTAVLGAVTALSAFFMSDEIRRQVLATLKNVLNSPVTRGVALVGLVIAAAFSTVTRNSVVWSGPEKIDIAFDGQTRTLTGELNKDGKKSATFRTIAWWKTRLSMPGFDYEHTGRPFRIDVVDIPVHVTGINDARIEVVENALLLTFFQFFESKRLDFASNHLAAFPSTGPADLPAINRLRSIYNFLRIAFVDPDESDNRTALLEQFRSTYPGDPWIELLQAARDYSRKEYASCMNRMPDEFIESIRVRARKTFVGTALFFRGVCTMRDSIARPQNDASTALLRKAVLDFERSETQLAVESGTNIQSIAYPSSVLFQGIAFFYLREEDSAVERFEKASGKATGGLKARALNARAFVKFVNGDINGAEPDLLAAMGEDQMYPLARTNYGFVLMAKNDLKRARKYFLQNANDEMLQRFSKKDVTLALVSLAHISEMDRTAQERAIEEYAAVLRELRRNDYAAIDVPDLRLAYLLSEIADSVYLNGQYYALEMFALNCQCKADRLAAGLNGDPRASRLRQELSIKMQTLARKVNPKWLTFKQQGWFSELRNCNLTALITDGGAPASRSSN